MSVVHFAEEPASSSTPSRQSASPSRKSASPLRKSSSPKRSQSPSKQLKLAGQSLSAPLLARDTVDSDEVRLRFETNRGYNLDGILQVIFDIYHTGDLQLANNELEIFFTVHLLILPSKRLAVRLLNYLADMSEAKWEPASTLSRAAFGVFLINKWLSFDHRALCIIAFIKLEFDKIAHQLLADHASILALAIEAKCSQEQPIPSVSTIWQLSLDTRRVRKKQLLRMPPLVILQHLVGAHSYYLQLIRPWDIIEHNLMLPNQHCLEAAKHFNSVTSFLCTAVLREVSPKARSEVITLWIRVAASARRQNCLPVLLMLTSALDHHTITRLKQSWEFVLPKHKEELASLLELASPAKNFQTLRERSQQSGQHLPLALLNKDVLFCQETLLSGTPQYTKLRATGAMVLAQHNTIMIQSHNVLEHIEFFKDPLPRYSTDKMFTRSQQLEPLVTASSSTPTPTPTTFSTRTVRRMRANSSVSMSTIRSSNTLYSLLQEQRLSSVPKHHTTDAFTHSG